MTVGANQPLSSSATTVVLAAAVTTARLPLLGFGDTILVSNSTTGWAFVAFGDVNVIAVADAGIPVPPGASMLIRHPIANTIVQGTASQPVQYAAAILSTGTGKVYFTRGDGSTR